MFSRETLKPFIDSTGQTDLVFGDRRRPGSLKRQRKKGKESEGEEHRGKKEKKKRERGRETDTERKG